MHIIICDCGTELPFNERDLSVAAGQPFTCPICGRTRKLPLPNVFTTASPGPQDPPRHSLSVFKSRVPRALIKIGAFVTFIGLLVLGGVDQATRISGILVTAAAAAQFLFHAVQRDPPQTLITLSVSSLGGLLLFNSHWSTTLALAAIVISAILQQSLKKRLWQQLADRDTEHWRLESRPDKPAATFQ